MGPSGDADAGAPACLRCPEHRSAAPTPPTMIATGAAATTTAAAATATTATAAAAAKLASSGAPLPSPHRHRQPRAERFCHPTPPPPSPAHHDHFLTAPQTRRGPAGPGLGPGARPQARPGQTWQPAAVPLLDEIRPGDQYDLGVPGRPGRPEESRPGRGRMLVSVTTVDEPLRLSLRVLLLLLRRWPPPL